MDGNATSANDQGTGGLFRIAPGLGALAAYQRPWLKHDVIAGVCVAAVALPTAIAYAQIIGLDPVVGLYAAIPALLAYAVFGTSRHLIVNPDAATCAMVGAALVFYNASYFKKRVLELAALQPGLKWFVVDGSTINTMDSTGADVLEVLAGDLARRGIRLGLAGFRTEIRDLLERTGALAALGADAVFPTLKAATHGVLDVESTAQAGEAAAEYSS